MSQHPRLALAGLSKTYGDSYRLGPLDLIVGAGETIGVLGRNGAGKTTFFQLITGNLSASAGQIHADGARLRPDTPLIKRKIGYLPQDAVLPAWATARELLLYAAQLHGLEDATKRVAAAEAAWDCTAFARKPLATISYGMHKRVGLALATLHDPALLVLDEPFSGLDLEHIRILTDALRERSRRGQTTLLSTHVLSFCAELCDRCLLIRRDSGGKTSHMGDLPGWQEADVAGKVAIIEREFFGKGQT